MQKGITFVSFFLLVSISILQGQVDTLWTKTFGGNRNEMGYSGQQTQDDGYIITGFTESFGDLTRNVLLIKTDKNGNEIWNKVFGDYSWEEGIDVEQTLDGGYIIAGITDPTSSAMYDIWLLKTDENGDTLWTKRYGGSQDERAYSIKQTSDAGYIITGNKFFNGYPYSQVWLIKTDQNGSIEWDNTFGGNYNEFGYDVVETHDEKYIVVGATHSYGAGNYDVWLIKTDQNGNEIWNNTFGGNNLDWGYCIQQTNDGGYIVSGSTISYSAGQEDVWLIKVDSSGNELWNNSFGGSGNECGESVRQTPDGGYIVAGNTESYSSGLEDAWLIKTDESGNYVWDLVLGDIFADVGNSIQVTSDKGYIIIGSTGAGGNPSDGDVWLIKTAPITLLEPNGGEIWYPGEEQTISWKSEYVEQLKIELSSDDGINWATLTDSTANDGIYSFILTPQVPSTECLIKVSDVQDINISDITDSVFAIAGISVISPNGGEIYMVNDTINISWFSQYITNVTIELSIDNGLNWNTIVDSTSSSGNFSWVVNVSDSSDKCLLKIKDFIDNSLYDVSDSVFIIDNISSAEYYLNCEFLSHYSLNQNFPNPFNPSTTFKYQNPEISFVTLKIYDVLGNEITTLVNEEKPAGTFEITWYAANHPSGVYFYQLKTGSFIESKKMILLK